MNVIDIVVVWLRATLIQLCSWFFALLLDLELKFAAIEKGLGFEMLRMG